MTTSLEININQPDQPVPPSLSQLVDTINKLKAELETSRTLKENQYVQALVQKIQGLTETAMHEAASQPKNGASQNGHNASEWQQVRDLVWNITQQMGQVPQIDGVFQVTVNLVREYLQADRVLIFQLDEKGSNNIARQEGKIIAEACLPGYLPCLGTSLPAVGFTGERQPASIPSMSLEWRNPTPVNNTPIAINHLSPIFVCDDIYSLDVNPYQRQLLERFQVKANLSQPIMLDGELWGFLVVQQCAMARHWKEVETYLVSQISLELTLILQRSQFRSQLSRQKEIDLAVTKVVDKIRQSLNIEAIFETTTSEVRILLKADRVAVYKFDERWGGEFVAESVNKGWNPLIGSDRAKVNDTYLYETKGGRYAKGESAPVDDIYKTGFDSCHLELLERFECRAYIIVPVFQGEKLWGLLAAYQNNGPRHWLDFEVKLLEQIGKQLGLALQQAEYFQTVEAQAKELAEVVERDRQTLAEQEETAARARIVSRVVERFLQNQDIEAIFSVTVREIRSLLDADRVGVFKFYPNAGYDDGEFIAEDVLPGYSSAKAVKIHDHCFGQQYAPAYRDGRIQNLPDIYNAGLTDCHIDVLSQFQVRANMIIPMLKNSQLWGLLCVHQCRGPKVWDDNDVTFVKQIASQFSVGLQQAEFVEQIRQKSEKLAEAAEREKAISQIIDKIRLSSSIDGIFQTTVHEVRRLLKTDRVGVFKFNPDWSGQFIMESINGGWVKLVDNTSLKNLRENIMCQGLQSMAGINNFQSDIKDTYLQDNKGGIYRKKKHFVCHDVYKSNFPSCYVQLLEQFEAKAYISVPIFKGDQLWGLLATYQNSAARAWEESEINLMTQIGDQLGIALQQADFLQQLQAQSQQLALAAEREKQAKEQLQQGAIQLLSSVAPVLMGDLTVRAVVTEDEVGTIADAYNNTIQSLRQLVMQIQTAAIQLAQTSQNSEVSIVELSTQAQGQLQEINHALAEIQAMVKSTEAVTTNAQQVEVAVQKANTTVKRSGDAMNRTVEGIQGIRKTVSVTREKIKRLSESSQNISKVVSLISNFATQTNLLALNAALEATRAGEYGKGFAVVADEVRSLARQSAAATAEIEALVAEIQTETTQVATAMELGIRQVVKGNELVDETKESLTAIVSATAQISELVKGIVEATQMQEVRSQSVTQTMTNVAGIASHTSDDAIQLATSFKQLLGLAETLQTSVGKFKV